MKILLVNPPRSPYNAIREHAPADALPFIHRKLIGPPLGLLTVAAAVKEHEVTVLDMKGEYDLHPAAPPPGALLTEYLERFAPDIVGVTVITSEFNAARELARAAKSFDPRILTVAGGLHPTLCPGDFAETPFDIVCPGQAALTFREIVRAREKGTPLERIAHLYLNAGDACRCTYTFAPKHMPDAAAADFLMPDRGHLRPWLSTYRVGRPGKSVTYLFTSLGCPHRCSFCSIWPQFDGKYYQRRAESVIGELATLDEYEVVRFADANTVVDTRFIDALFDGIARAGIKKEYVMDLRADTAARHPELIEKLARGGLRVVIAGFESFRNEELEKYRKSADAKLIAEAIAVLHANDIQIRGNYVVPPEYDESDFAALAEYAGSHRVAFAGYTALTPLPGTSLYEESRDDIVDHNLDKYNLFNCVLRTRLPLERYYENIGKLWPIKKGLEVI